MLITLFGVAVIVFFVIRVVPGNPIAMMLPPGAGEEDIARLKALYGFDKSLPEQFVIWVAGVLQGDFGTSISTRQPVLSLVLGRLPATIELAYSRSNLGPTMTLMLSQLLIYLMVDPIIYAETGAHPYMTALSVVGGLYVLGIEGIVLGPLILVVVTVILEFALKKQRQATTGLNAHRDVDATPLQQSKRKLQ